jgi:hypothetical protein
VGTPHSSSPSSISSSQQRSLAASIRVSLPKRPFGAPASETTSAGHTYQLRHLTNVEANRRAKLRIKGSHFSEPDYSTLITHSSWHIKKSNQLQTYQEGGNYVRPPGHDSSWTGHNSTQHSTLTASPENHIQDFKQIDQTLYMTLD